MPVKFTYTNYKEETEVRTVTPLYLTYYDFPAKVSDHLKTYPAGWFLVAYDEDRKAERSFYLGFDFERRLVIGASGAEVVGWPLRFDAPIEAAVDQLAKHAVEHAAKKQTSPEVSAIAGRYLGMTKQQRLAHVKDHPSNVADELATFSASLLGQDEIKG